MPALTAADVAAIVAQTLASLGVGQTPEPVAPAAPVQSAPVTARIASPFAKTGTVAGPLSVGARAIAAHPNDRRQARVQVAISREPLWTCTVDTTATLSDGTEVPSALHGFLTEQTAGAPCPGVYGVSKGTACPGTIRAE